MSRPGRLWLFVILLALVLLAIVPLSRLFGQAVPTYTTQLLTAPDSVGLAVTWRRDSIASGFSWGNVLICSGGDAGVPEGCEFLPRFHDSTFAASGVAVARFSLAGLAGKTIALSACVQTQFGGAARNSYPCPKVASSYVVPPTAPPRPPPTYSRWRYDSTFAGGPILLRVATRTPPLDCPIVILYDETPTTPLYTITPKAGAPAACTPYVAAMSAAWAR